MTIDLRLLAVSLFLVSGCGGSNPAAAPAQPPAATAPSVPQRTKMEPIAAGQGSSDGTTCEQARASYTEEVSMGARGPSDLSADDFAAILNRGTYL